MSDLISRQAAIDSISCDIIVTGKRNAELVAETIGTFVDRIKALPSEESEIIRCKDCKHFEYDHPYLMQGVPVLGHLVCNKWGDGCRTSEDGFCFLAERRTNE